MRLLERFRPTPARRVEALMAQARAHADAGRAREALAIWEPLARAGEVRAQNNIGACFANGLGVEADLELAHRWIEPAAQAGDPVAMRNLATMLAQGLGVPDDPEAAVRWYQAAAERGDPVAQDMLAWMLTDGGWLPPDDDAALRWTRAAAEAGVARAQARLGRMHHEAGAGLPRDLKAAVRWWRLAARQGEVEAQTMLGAALHMGRGVAADQVEALHWLTRAMRSGAPHAGNFRARVLERLTPAEVAVAERRALEPHL